MTHTLDGEYDAVIVGAGMSGIAAYRALREEGVQSILIIERAAEFGGTWRENTYPGCECDVPSPIYSYTDAHNADWSKLYANQQEIQRYLVDTAEHWGVRDAVRFGVTFLGAHWDDANGQWKIRTDAGDVTATLAIGAAGPWSTPSVPDLPGAADFGGVTFHSARWRHDVDLSGKRVVVIGTGASAVQFVPEIVDAAEHVTIYQRTPQWVLPKPNYHQPTAFRWLLRRSPAVARIQRAVIYRILELVAFGTRHSRAMKIAHTIGRWQIKRQISDADLREIVTPEYVFGCKRPLFANTWYPTLDRADVTVRPSGVARLTETGVIGTDGIEVPADVIIYGTGFHITDMPLAEQVFDADGLSLSDHWRGSPKVYLGTTTHGFPNFAILLGPGLGTLASAFTVTETQLGLIRSLVRTTRELGAKVFDTRADAEQTYNNDRTDALATTVYNIGGCTSYFIDKTGTNSFSWPWSTDTMRRRLRTADPAAYEFTR
ncbi:MULTISPECIES: NAD(P)/FAD-dependent oxidoreductase [unclassified Rhodococcus (in: high G+C Gram-positive bacteria)]|uniref:flavin-containing monooxygenase n=1 Tax=unclassified Rhodococcus (in: high G+C Gram-positive bacteria) TaxID=192944 RepID=UPI003398DFE6